MSSRETDEDRTWLRRRLNEEILVDKRSHVKELLLDNFPTAESQLELAKSLTDEDINRFIRARPDNHGSLQLLEKHVAIRAKVRPWEVTRAMNEDAFSTGLCRYAGWSYCGWPILMVDLDHLDVTKVRLDNVDSYVMSVFEGLIEFYMGQGVDKYVCMINLRNVGTRMSSVHRRVFGRVMQVFAPFPERLGGVCFLNPPSNFAAVWWAMKCILPAPFLAKVRVVESVEEYDTFIDPAEAERNTVVGGSHDAYPPCAPFTELQRLNIKPPSMNEVVPRFGQTIPRSRRASETQLPVGASGSRRASKASDLDELPRASTSSNGGGDTRSARTSWFGLECCTARDRSRDADSDEEPEVPSPRAPPLWPRVAQEVPHEDEPWEDPWTTSIAQAAHQTLEVYEDTADAAESAVNMVIETVEQTVEEVSLTVEKAVEDVGQALQDVAESVSEVVDATSQYVSESMDAAYDKTCSVFADLVAFTTLAARWMDAELIATRRRLAWAADFVVRSWQKNFADSRVWTNRANKQFWCAVRDVGGRMWRPFRRAVSC